MCVHDDGRHAIDLLTKAKVKGLVAGHDIKVHLRSSRGQVLVKRGGLHLEVIKEGPEGDTVATVIRGEHDQMITRSDGFFKVLHGR